MNSKKYVIIGLLLIVVCAQACGPAMVKMDQANRTLLQGETLHAISYEPAGFMLATSGKAAAAGLFGLLGGVAAASSMENAGKKMVEEFQIADPVLSIKAEFLEAKMSDPAFSGIQDSSSLRKDDSIDGLKRSLGNGNVLDFKTTEWGLVYYPLAWNHYRVTYQGRARLIRLADKKVLWQGVCKFIEEEPPASRPTLDQLKANNGTLLKEKLSKVAEDCSGRLIAQFQDESVASKRKEGVKWGSTSLDSGQVGNREEGE